MESKYQNYKSKIKKIRYKGAKEQRDREENEYRITKYNGSGKVKAKNVKP